MILNTGDFWEPSDEDMIEWAKTYPAIDVYTEVRKMESWLDANPKKRKTKSGIKRFVNAWLSRAQDKGGSPSTLTIKGNECKGINCLTDVSWISGEQKERMKTYYLKKHGQYWDGKTYSAGAN